MAVAQPHSAELGQGPRRERPVSVGGAIQRLVVEHDRVTVPGSAHIGLDPGGTHVDRVLERAACVLGGLGRPTAVRQPDRTGPEGVPGQGCHYLRSRT